MSTLRATVQEKLAREVLRKLRLAVEAEEKEDREIICGEVFSDITCPLDAHAKEELGAQDASLYFEVLAQHFQKLDTDVPQIDAWNETAISVQKHDGAEALLYVCRRLWGQPHVAPIYAMLLFRWLLLNKDAGGSEQRLKHLGVMVSGMRQMFWGDVEAGTMHMKPMHGFMADDVVFSTDRRRLDSLPHQARGAVLSVVAAYLPYYTSNPEGLRLALEGFPSPAHTLSEGGHRDGEAADYIISEVTETIRHISGERGLLRYLGALQKTPESPHFKAIRPVTRLMLESELYQLTAVGGPRYLPRAVNSAAFQTLDRLFPRGQWSRRLISWVCRVIHPTEWPWMSKDAASQAAGTADASARFAWYSLSAWCSFWVRGVQSLLQRLLPRRFNAGWGRQQRQTSPQHLE